MSEGVKHIYFIRHGQTAKNRTQTHQRPTEPLTPHGRSQAAQVAESLCDRQIEKLFTSTYTRARETADIIGAHLQLPVESVDFVHEFVRPEYLYGKSHYAPSSIRSIANLYLHRNEPEWNDGGAENFTQVRERIKKTKNFFSQVEGEHIAVVSHAIFMDMFAEIVCRNGDITLWKFLHGLLLAKRVPNTGMLHFTCTEPRDDQCTWLLQEMIVPTKAT